MVDTLPAQLLHDDDLVAIIAAKAAVFFRHGNAQKPCITRRIPQFARDRRSRDPLGELFRRGVVVDPFGDAVIEQDEVFILHEGRQRQVQDIGGHWASSW